jgi:hypothetical protein
MRSNPILTLETYKQALGEKASHFSDAELTRLLGLHRLMARVLFDMWRKEQREKRPGKFSDPSSE